MLKISRLIPNFASWAMPSVLSPFCKLNRNILIFVLFSWYCPSFEMLWSKAIRHIWMTICHMWRVENVLDNAAVDKVNLVSASNETFFLSEKCYIKARAVKCKNEALTLLEVLIFTVMKIIKLCIDDDTLRKTPYNLRPSGNHLQSKVGYSLFYYEFIITLRQVFYRRHVCNSISIKCHHRSRISRRRWRAWTSSTSGRWWPTWARRRRIWRTTLPPQLMKWARYCYYFNYNSITFLSMPFYSA